MFIENKVFEKWFCSIFKGKLKSNQVFREIGYTKEQLLADKIIVE